MEGIAAVGGAFKGYWKKRSRYQRLDGWRRGGRRRMPTVQLGEGGGAVPPPVQRRRRRFWRVKLSPRVKLIRMMRFSPKRFLLGLRDAYVNFMNRMAGSRYINSGMAGGYSGGLGGFGGFGPGPVKEYDEKMIIQIYKSLVLAQSQLVNPPEGAPPPRIAPPPPLATIAEC